MRTIHYVRDPRFQVRIVEHFFRLASSLKWVKSLPGSSSTHLGQAGMRRPECLPGTSRVGLAPTSFGRMISRKG